MRQKGSACSILRARDFTNRWDTQCAVGSQTGSRQSRTTRRAPVAHTNDVDTGTTVPANGTVVPRHWHFDAQRRSETCADVAARTDKRVRQRDACADSNAARASLNQPYLHPARDTDPRGATTAPGRANRRERIRRRE